MHLLAARGASGVVALWDVRSPTSLQRLVIEQPSPADVAAAATASATASSPPTDPRLSAAEGSDSSAPLCGALCWAPHARCEHELVASSQGELRLWDIRRAQRPVAAWDAHSDASVLSLSWRLLPHKATGEVTPCLLSCGRDGALRVWQIGSGAGAADALLADESAESLSLIHI